MSVDPESLSKEKLKAELRKSGVTFNQYENKPYYVKLYRDKLRRKELSRAEFSDDEDTGRTTRGSRRNVRFLYFFKSFCISNFGVYEDLVYVCKVKKDSPSGLFNEVKMMSDSTLRSVLMGHGENPGPITETTRNLYERKLVNYLEKASTPSKSEKQQSISKGKGVVFFVV